MATREQVQTAQAGLMAQHLGKQQMNITSASVRIGDCLACGQPINAVLDISAQVAITGQPNGGWTPGAPTGAPKAPPLSIEIRGHLTANPVIERMSITHRCGGRIQPAADAPKGGEW